MNHCMSHHPQSSGKIERFRKILTNLMQMPEVAIGRSVLGLLFGPTKSAPHLSRGAIPSSSHLVADLVFHT